MNLSRTTSPCNNTEITNTKSWGFLLLVQSILSFFQWSASLVKAFYQSSILQQIFALHDYVFYLEVFNVTKSSHSKDKKATKVQEVGNTTSYISASVLAPPGLNDEPAPDTTSVFLNDEKCLHLHSKICSQSFNKNVDCVLAEAMDVISNKMFLNIDHMIKGGSVKKEVAIAGLTNVEAVFFLQHLPKEGHEKWLPPLLKAVCNALNLHFDKKQLGVEAIDLTRDSVQLRINGIVTMDLRFSPLFDSYRAVLSALSRQGASVHHLFKGAFITQRTHFVAKQREHVKVTIRLLKWWRDQQVWSSELTRPSDEMLEIVAIHSANTSTAFTQRKAMANAMSCLAHFDELRIVLSDYYSENDIWQPLLPQRPLLMDPTNPYINVSDPLIFDPSEVMRFAESQS